MNLLEGVGSRLGDGRVESGTLQRGGESGWGGAGAARRGGRMSRREPQALGPRV